MKNLIEYLNESKKTYKFKVGVAGELPENFESKLKIAIEKYGLVSLSSGKKTPIQERPLDFPNLENTEVTFYEIEINYPTTDHVLQEYLGNFCSVNRSHLIVRNPDAPVEYEKDKKDPLVYEPILTNNTLEDNSAQQSVGQSRVMDLLRELETARKENPDSAQSGFKLESSKSEPQNTKSVVGN